MWFGILCCVFLSLQLIKLHGRNVQLEAFAKLVSVWGGTRGTGIQPHLEDDLRSNRSFH